MIRSASARSRLASLRRITSQPRIGAGATYLIASPAVSALIALIGSTSEYRFPHPLVATLLQLFTSLILLYCLLAANKVFRRRRGRRKTSKTDTDPKFSTFEPLALFLPGDPSYAGPTSVRTAVTVLATACSTFSSLCEIRAYRIADPAFLAFTRLLPLLAAAALPLILPLRYIPRELRRAGDTRSYAMLWLVLMAGEGVTAKAGRGGWPVALGWAAGALGWVLALKTAVTPTQVRAEDVAGTRRANKSALRPSLLNHLVLSVVFLALPVLCSTEVDDIRRFRHYNFFLEPGFWVQEIAIALLSLASLASFRHLVSTCSPLGVLSLAATKDVVLLPRLYVALFGNPRDALVQGEAFLSEGQQLALLTLLGGWLLLRAAEQDEAVLGVDDTGIARLKDV